MARPAFGRTRLVAPVGRSPLTPLRRAARRGGGIAWSHAPTGARPASSRPGVGLGLPSPAPGRGQLGVGRGVARWGPDRADDHVVAGAGDQPPADLLPAAGRLRRRCAAPRDGFVVVRVEGPRLLPRPRGRRRGRSPRGWFYATPTPGFAAITDAVAVMPGSGGPVRRGRRGRSAPRPAASTAGGSPTAWWVRSRAAPARTVGEAAGVGRPVRRLGVSRVRGRRPAPPERYAARPRPACAPGPRR